MHDWSRWNDWRLKYILPTHLQTTLNEVAFMSPAKTIAIEDVPHHADFRHLATIANTKIDLRYGTTNNFVGRNLYGDIDCAWLHRDAADALARAVAWLKTQRDGVSLLILDALRPQRIQVSLWEALEGTDLHMYLAEPTRGSIHSFGMAVDATLIDAAGIELDMGTPFDDMTEKSHPAKEAEFIASGELTPAQLANRKLLRDAMQHAGFQSISTEWWHFDFGDRLKVRRDYARVL
jgi:zinc D-Ala-D-Ala dipeptidase